MSALQEKREAVEEEFGEPFWDVVEGFAEMGYSRRQVAEILELPLLRFTELANTERPDITFPARGRADNDNERRDSAFIASRIKEGRLRSGKRIRFITYRDRTMPISYWDRQIGATYRGVVAKRIARGWDTDRAVSVPVNRAANDNGETPAGGGEQ